jgi:hypothetical protein
MFASGVMVLEAYHDSGRVGTAEAMATRQKSVEWVSLFVV